MSTFAHTDTVAVDTGTGKTTSLIKEACIDSLQSALAAQSCGANRVELCADLDFDGLTPSESLVREVFARLSIPIRVMVRPRHDTFVYTAEDVATMKLSILLFKSIGVEGVVLGCLKEDRSLDIELIEELAEVAYPELNVVVHKAIDHTPDPLDALRSILALNRRAERNLIRAVLTSGGNFRRAIEGEAVLRDMQSLIDRTVNGHRAFNGSGCNRNPKVDKKTEIEDIDVKPSSQLTPTTEITVNIPTVTPIELVVAGQVTPSTIDRLRVATGATSFHGKKVVGNLTI